jgi:hypothetical protein
MIDSRYWFVTGLGNTTTAPFGPRANAAMRCLISAASRTPAGVYCTPNEGAADSIVRRKTVHDGFAGSKITAILLMVGAHCFRSCSHFPPTENSKLVKPVMLPSGRARLVTKLAESRAATTESLPANRFCASCRSGDSERPGGNDHIRVPFD